VAVAMAGQPLVAVSWEGQPVPPPRRSVVGMDWMEVFSRAGQSLHPASRIQVWNGVEALSRVVSF
jgi:hypothetical protein